jgi:ATP-dependent Lhr-like helicase
LRKQIEPVTAAQFMQWLLRWQHVAAGTQVAGERGTLEVLRQLQGFEIPANAWERQVLARRIVDYDPKWLDQLCLTGAVGWGRLSPHRRRSIIPIRAAEQKLNRVCLRASGGSFLPALRPSRSSSEKMRTG